MSHEREFETCQTETEPYTSQSFICDCDLKKGIYEPKLGAMTVSSIVMIELQTEFFGH